jgi:hypothetical protein
MVKSQPAAAETIMPPRRRMESSTSDVRSRRSHAQA